MEAGGIPGGSAGLVEGKEQQRSVEINFEGLYENGSQDKANSFRRIV